MKFGSVDNPELIDFTFPKDHLDTQESSRKSER